MADVIVGKSTKDKLVAFEDKTQIYGLKGNDTLISDNKNEILLIGGSGNDVLRMTGGTGTLSGGAGKDTFALNYSADKKISAVIEDIEPTKDKIVVTFDGNKAPKLKYTVKGSDVIWTDDKGYFKLTIKGSSDASDYYEGDAHEYIWDILRITNQERENQGLEPLTLSQGLTDAAAVRSEEIVETHGHTRPDGSSCFTAVKKSYWGMGENLAWRQTLPEEAMTSWMNSTGHRANILTADFKKLGVGYTYDADSEWIYHWVQMFGSDLMSPDTLSTEEILSAKITTKTGDLPEEETPTINTVLATGNTTIKRGGTYTIAKNFSGTIRISTSDAVTIDGTNSGNLKGVHITTITETADLTIKNLKITNTDSSAITFGSGKGNKLTIAGTNTFKTSDTWAAVVNVGGGLTVDGSGTLNLTAGTQGSGIGSKSYDESTADITIKNGKIITVTELGAGVGSGSSGSIGNIKITGGTLKSTSTWAAGVGKGWNGSVGNILFSGGSAKDNVSFNGDNATILGGTGNDTIQNSGSNVIFKYDSGDGNDLIKGFNETSTLQVNSDYSTVKSGSDIVVTVGKGKITLQGAASLSKVNVETRLTLTNSSKSPVTVDSAIKTVDASSRTKAINITGNKLANIILGGSKNDSLYGAAGNDSLVGNAGNDYINGGAGKDTLSGGKGNDSLWGGAGNDSLYGGAGKDVFIYKPNEGTDTIFDYAAGDMLKILKSDGKEGGDFTSSTFKSNKLTLAIDGGGKVVFSGVSSSTNFNINGTTYKISGTKLVSG